MNNALRDVQIALQLQPGYARAYARMGYELMYHKFLYSGLYLNAHFTQVFFVCSVIYSSMGKTQEAYSCYLQAVELEPTNESYANNLRLVTESLEGNGEGDPGASGANFFADVFQNPQLLTMASQMLQDPNMQAM